MANSIDLVTQSQVENFLNSNNANFNPTYANVLIPLAITAVSRAWLRQTGRRALNRFVPCNDFLDGSSTDRQFVRDWPIAKVGGVWSNGTQIPAGGWGESGEVTPGWVLDDKRESISIVGLGKSGWGLGIGAGTGGSYAATGGPLVRQQLGGWNFGYRGGDNRHNVQIQYWAGGMIAFNELWQIPANSPYQITVAEASSYYLDITDASQNQYGVTYQQPQNGVMAFFTPVASLPSQGEYTVANGLYTFSAADAGQYVGITYAYNGTPEDIQEVAIIQVAETLEKRKQIGLKSQGSPESGTTSYTWNVAWPAIALETANAYKRVMVGM